ncbi:DoxX family membrane protein [Micromonospora sp. RHAY321]|uniref:DoxX family membrane protein n=1 Tax=Micromonospora sp. RHAY321 TaxID=2944807 RepID=UPI00207D11FC|nr:DoxX family membrane protein [Micromonospora sp. RHAY321]MCO1594994.1 DoxX family membrane protein [Micromonospora sp. RHAY321]
METMTATIERNTGTTAPAVGTPRERAVRYVLAGTRLALGWIFLWAFVDKLFGLGRATGTKDAWINGGSPTKGFLTFGATGPFKDLYAGIAGAAWADWLFMIGLAGIGVALLLGVGMRVAAVAGGLLLVLMWTAVLPPENNPVMDDHLVYAAVLAVLALVDAGDTWGLGRAWARLPIVRRVPWLR